MRWYNYLKSRDEQSALVESYSGNKTKSKSLMDCEEIEEFNLVICQKLEFLYFARFKNYQKQKNF